MASIESIAKELEERAEEMENDQRLVTEMMVKYDRSDIVEASNLVNWAEVLKTYSEKTLTRMLESGTNLGFTVNLRNAMYGKLMREVSYRGADREVPEGNGMSEDGDQ